MSFYIKIVTHVNLLPIMEIGGVSIMIYKRKKLKFFHVEETCQKMEKKIA